MPKTEGSGADPGRGRRGAERISVTATEMKNRFGRMLDEVAQGKAVVVTKHDQARAVLISIDEYESLSGSFENDLDTLSAKFDALLAGMQTAEAVAGMEAAFSASPEALGRAAVAAAARERSAG